MPIIGTAGHVDHGKSTLIQALTGRDPDRWAEEKERGLTIDLGFAWATVGDGAVGFVDVPGHERFIKNMLAGVGGVDVALFVVAADEGWMPQSEEHLAVLDLLGVHNGVIAITRIDVADPELVALSRSDVEDHVHETVAESWPVVEVSAITGSGIDRLTAALGAALARAGPTPSTGRPRMWIDRSFGIAGAGVVATGTLTGGAIRVGDRLQAFPGGEVRIRALQSHEADCDEIAPGNRAAVNLVGIEQRDLARGTLLARQGSIATSGRFLAALRFPLRSERDVTDRGAYHVHLGTATIPSRIRVLDAGDHPSAIVTTATPVPVTMGDRFILRDTGRRSVVAGGTVLDPLADKSPSATDVEVLASAVESSPDLRADALVGVHGSIDALTLDQASGGGRPPSAVSTGDRYFARDYVAARRVELEAAVADHHARYPLRPGLPKSEAASRLGIDPNLVAFLIEGHADLIEDGPVIRRADFAPSLGEEDEVAWRSARALLAKTLAVPRASELGLSPEVRHALVRSGDLVPIEEDLVLMPDQVTTITTGLGALPEAFTVADFRDHFGLSRRQAVPLLEWLDHRGLTRRSGDTRSLRSPRGGAAGAAQTQ